MPATPRPHIVFLRAVNLGSSRRLDMAALRDALTAAGFDRVRTFLQSGNVVLVSDLAPARLAEQVERQIEQRLELEVQVVVRTRDELADVIQRDPLGDVASNPSRYLVNFLSARPGPEAVRALEEADVAPEQVVVSGREIYAWHPDGVQRSRVNRLLTERKLGVIATARNWNTVVKLLAIADQ
ncbi:MAG: DUF1697 domain-containing protein [Gaiellales bacterium]